jgi:hypothetical protein
LAGSKPRRTATRRDRESLCPGQALPAQACRGPGTSAGITPPSSLLRTHAPDLRSPWGFVYLVPTVRAGCRWSLLAEGLSRRYLCDLCGGAWTLTPPRSPGALTRFFPRDIGLTSESTRSARQNIPGKATSLRGGSFRGCSHSLMFRLPNSLGPPVAPTARVQSPLGGRAVYTTQNFCGCPPEAVVSLRV